MIDVEWHALGTENARLRKVNATLLEALDIITRACEAGAYVGRTSPAVTQARAALRTAKGKS